MSDESDKSSATASTAELSQAELATLVDALRQHDEAAFACLYNHTVHRVYRLAMAITRHVEDAEEVVCDVYWQVWQRAHQYDPKRGTVLAWLLIHCRSAAIDLLRRRSRDRSETDADPCDIPDEAHSTDALLAWVDERSTVHRALQTLSVTQRQVIEWAYFHDLSHHAIAQTMQLPVGTVKSHLRRGLQKLRTALEIPLSSACDDQ